MRYAYIDDAGLGDPLVEPLTFYLGLIVRDNQVGAINDRLREIHELAPAYRHIPFHANDLFKLGQKQRDLLLPPLAAMPREFQLPICVGKIDRVNGPKFAAYGESGERRILRGAPFVECVYEVETWHRTNAPNESCQLIIEDNPKARADLAGVIQHLQSEEFAEMLHADVGLDRNAGRFPFSHIKGAPDFRPKTTPSPLELADFCVYVTKRHLMNPMDPMYREYFGQLRPQIDGPLAYATLLPFL